MHKKFLTIIFVLLLLALSTITLAGAIPTHIPYSKHTVRGPQSKTDLSGKNVNSPNEAAAKKARNKKVSSNKVELPNGAKPLGYPINTSQRIDTLCGYELGTIIKVPVRPTIDNEGNILVVERLRKPFRKCTQVTLHYSSVNHALYGIELFSEGDVKMSQDEAWDELKEMAKALKSKFNDKIICCDENKSFMSLSARMGTFMGNYSGQFITLSAQKKDIVKKSAMKGIEPKKGWVLSLTLIDHAMHSYDPESALPSKLEEDDVPAGADVL